MATSLYARTTVLKLACALVLFAPLNVGSLGADDYRAALSRGDELRGRFDDAGAVVQYEKAHQLDPNNFEALEKLTRASEDLGNELAVKKPRDAEQYFSRAIQAAQLMRQQYPDRADAYFYLAAAHGGLALIKHGTEKVRLGGRVEEYAKKAITLDPHYAPAYAVLGVFYREVASLSWIERAFANSFYGGIPRVGYQDSIRMLEKAVEIQPTSLYAHYQLALTYQETGHRDEALKALQQTVALAPLNGFEVELKAEAQRRLQRLST